tara:strand:+ start:648 stop:1175 length:528 start_codon:yes stop_codon:yes gene_type:complete
MNFPNAIKSYFKNWIKFSGRSSRSEFWWAVLFANIIIYSGLLILTIMNVDNSGFLALVSILLAGLIIFLALASSALSVRRLHDINKSGLIYIVYIAVVFISALPSNQKNYEISDIFSIIQMIFSIVLIVLYCLPGKSENNKYGPNPLFINGSNNSDANNENNNLIEEKTIWDENK